MCLMRTVGLVWFWPSLPENFSSGTGFTSVHSPKPDEGVHLYREPVKVCVYRAPDTGVKVCVSIESLMLV